MIGLAIKLLGIRNAIARAFAWATQSAAHIFAVACLLAVAWGAVGWHGKRKAERVLATTEAAWRQASKDATAAQNALNLATQARYRAEAEKVDHGYQKARNDALRAADGYIARNRVRCPAAGGTGPADSTAQGGVAASGDGSGNAPFMVAVTPEDVRICTDNTARLEAVREWGQGLVASGLAEAGD